MSGNGHKLKHRSFHQIIRKHCEGDQALAQVAQRVCGDFVLGDIEKLSGHGPRQLSLGGPELDKMTSRGSCQPQPFCESVTCTIHLQHCIVCPIVINVKAMQDKGQRVVHRTVSKMSCIFGEELPSLTIAAAAF